jgi:hypothetical protein
LRNAILAGNTAGIAASSVARDVAITAKYTPGALGSAFTVYGTTATDVVNLTVGLGNLTAYRPMNRSLTSTSWYSPFAKTAVADHHEERTDLGPGIRINGDDDGSREDDLVEVKVERAAGVVFSREGLRVNLRRQ